MANVLNQKSMLNANIDRMIAIEIGDDVQVINLIGTHKSLHSEM